MNDAHWCLMFDYEELPCDCMKLIAELRQLTAERMVLLRTLQCLADRGEPLAALCLEWVRHGSPWPKSEATK